MARTALALISAFSLETASALDPYSWFDRECAANSCAQIIPTATIVLTRK